MSVVGVEEIWPEWRGVERLGSGAYGTVWRATHDSTGAVVVRAVKVIEILRADVPEGASVDAVIDERVHGVLAEIEAMALLRDVPHIVRIDDYKLIAMRDGAGYAIGIRMELLEGLRGFFERVGQPDAREVALIGIDVCHALEACHGRKMIHRDVKPGNVFFDAEHGIYKLGDFGVARRLESETAQTMSRKGTNAYMAPEVYFGRRYGANVDVYSLGIMMYRLLNRGRSPFMPLPPLPAGDHDAQQAEQRRLMGEALPLPIDADEELGRIVCRACEPNARERYATAAEMREDLEAWLAGVETCGARVGAGGGGESVRDAGLSVGHSLSRRGFICAGIVAIAAAGLGMWRTFSRARTRRVVAVAAGDYHTVGVYDDGTCVACGSDGAGQCDVGGWTDVVAVAAGSAHTVGVRADGTCIACGENGSGQCDVRDWSDVVSIAAGSYHTVGVKADGTCVACGGDGAGQCDVDGWTDVVAVAAGAAHTVGVRADGTCIACGENGSGQCDVRDWAHIADVAAASNHTAGLCEDGTVVTVGAGYFSGVARATELGPMVAIATGTWGTVGVQSDGHVSAVGSFGRASDSASVLTWSDVLSVAVGDGHIVGVRRNGSVVATGSNSFGQCDVASW